LNIDGVTPVPEPITWALAIFGGVFGGFQLVRRMVVRKAQRRILQPHWTSHVRTFFNAFLCCVHSGSR
jgi:hypothetical protein